jgi:alanine racemase
LDLAVAVTTRQLVYALAHAAAVYGRPARVHVKVDTGMTRYGVLPSEAIAFVAWCAATPGIDIEGIFTHLATADEPGSAQAIQQLSTFGEVCSAVHAAGVHPRIQHALNSAGMVVFPQGRLDLVRSGICVYGVSPADIAGLPVLRPALSLKARVARLRRVPAGTSIGYGSTYTTTVPTDVALLPIGYADGLSRSMSNRGSALVHGCRVPIVGRVSMDQCTIDVTTVRRICHDDEVTLLGGDGDAAISATEMASWRDTIAYEVLTGLSLRIPRVYMRAGRAVAYAENGEFRRLED